MVTTGPTVILILIQVEEMKLNNQNAHDHEIAHVGTFSLQLVHRCIFLLFPLPIEMLIIITVFLYMYIIKEGI